LTTIYLETIINAPASICFDLSRSIELHQFTTKHTGERAIAGRTSGLINKGEFVTWEAVHFFIMQKLSVKIIEMSRPETFVDEMIEGAFKSMWHQHEFVQKGQYTILKDNFRYEVPYGIFGKIFDRIVLKRYMRALLIERNNTIKQCAETEEWKTFLFYSD
jgi:ligand-binding SRPBCC domain-containing protein